VLATPSGAESVGVRVGDTVYQAKLSEEMTGSKAVSARSSEAEAPGDSRKMTHRNKAGKGE
jgi:hypothetical protein